jgi:molybdenum cofactor synthesis domain-containing protein
MLNPHEPRRFRVVGRVHAGDGEPSSTTTTATNADAVVVENLPEAFYVTTGAVIPDGCDCVVPVEDVVTPLLEHKRSVVEKEGGGGPIQPTSVGIVVIEVPPERSDSILRPGKWIRKVGFDLAPGQTVLDEGQELDAVSLGLLLQTGATKAGTVRVLRRIRVGVLSTGNELVENNSWLVSSSSSSSAKTGAASRLGTIPDANRPVLRSLLSSWNNCEVVDLGIVRDGDNAEETALTLRKAVEHRQCEVVISTGGISMGETDRMEEALGRLGAKVHFGRLHMKPGKPTTFATLSNRLFFCLPGNPVSAVVCAHLLVRPCLDLMYRAPMVLMQKQQEPGQSLQDLGGLRQELVQSLPVLHSEVPVILQNDVVLDAERPEYHRVRLEPVWPSTENTNRVVFHARSTGVQQSSRLTSLLNADALVLLPQASPENRKVVAGTLFWALLLRDNPLFPRLRLGESRHMMMPLVPAGNVSGDEDAVWYQSRELDAASPTAVDSRSNRHRPLLVEVVLLRCTKSPRAISAPLLKAVIAETDNDFAELCRQVQSALRGPGTNEVEIAASSRTYTYSSESTPPEAVWNQAGVAATTDSDCDVLVVAYQGPLLPQLRLAAYLKCNALSKLAPALAMDARQGIAATTAHSSSSAAYLFEVVVGVAGTSSSADASAGSPPRVKSDACPADHDELSHQRGNRLVLLLPLEGLPGALESIRRQISHGVRVAQGSH